MFSSWRAHGSQYCGVMPRRLASLWLAPPRCQRVPANTTTDPAGMVTLTKSALSGSGVSLPQRWLPGMTSVAPLSSVKSSIAQMVEMPAGFRGLG